MKKNEKSAALLRILIIEDVEDDALMLVDHLHSEGLDFDWVRVETEKDTVAELRNSWDIILSDYTMPGFNGVRVLELINQHHVDIPLIFISGTIGEETAVEAMKCGARDYVMKSNLTRLLSAVKRELHESRERQKRQHADILLRKLSRVVKQATDSVLITDPTGLIEYVNPAFEKLTGYSADEVVGKHFADFGSDRHDASCTELLWKKAIKGSNIFTGTLVNQRRNGELFYEEKVITPLKSAKNRITHYVSTSRDITERVRSEEKHAQLSAILEATTDLVALLEQNGCLRYLNSAGRRLLGVKAVENVNQLYLRDFISQDEKQLFAEACEAAFRSGVWEGEITLQPAKDDTLPASMVVQAHRSKNDKNDYLSIVARDISERKRFEVELQHQATHDRMTGLPNRFFLKDRFISALEYARRHNNNVAILFLDIDKFKRINDNLGHAAGDTLLQKVARKLQSCVRLSDTVARYGGDEFTIVVGEMNNAQNVFVLLRKLYKVFERPVIVDSQEIYVTFSIGIALYPNDGEGIDDLLHHADLAMYRAKSAGPNQYRFFAVDMNTRGHDVLSLEADLRRAFEQKQFLLHYQPQMNLQSGYIEGVEGLIRWEHPVRGLIFPADFISLMENSDMIISAGEWVLRKACQMHRIWRESGYGNLRVSINVSAAQFNDVNLLDKISRAVRDEKMSHQALELEITENVLMQDPVIATEVLQAIHALNVRIAIDDFGTGYSSLAYLKRFPLDVLKIDKTFVSDLVSNPGDAAIVEASISLAHKLGLEVIAEGVETMQQLNFMHAHRCDMVQGYYLSRPLNDVDLEAALLKNVDCNDELIRANRL